MRLIASPPIDRSEPQRGTIQHTCGALSRDLEAPVCFECSAELKPPAVDAKSSSLSLSASVEA